MARKITAQNRRFAACVRETFPQASSPKNYGRLMSDCLKGKKTQKGFRVAVPRKRR